MGAGAPGALGNGDSGAPTTGAAGFGATPILLARAATAGLNIAGAGVLCGGSTGAALGVTGTGDTGDKPQ